MFLLFIYLFIYLFIFYYLFYRMTQLSPLDASHLCCATWNKGIMELSLSARKQDERSSGGKKALQTVFKKDMR